MGVGVGFDEEDMVLVERMRFDVVSETLKNLRWKVEPRKEGLNRTVMLLGL